MTQAEAYAKAMAAVPRRDDGSIDLKVLRDEIAALLEIDIAAEKQMRAGQIIERFRKPGSTEPDGQLALEGLEPYAYEPDRLVMDDEHHVIEQARARANFKAAEARRVRIKAQQMLVHANRKTLESDGLSRWTIEQLEK